MNVVVTSLRGVGLLVYILVDTGSRTEWVSVLGQILHCVHSRVFDWERLSYRYATRLA